MRSGCPTSARTITQGAGETNRRLSPSGDRAANKPPSMTLRGSTLSHAPPGAREPRGPIRIYKTFSRGSEPRFEAVPETGRWREEYYEVDYSLGAGRADYRHYPAQRVSRHLDRRRRRRGGRRNTTLLRISASSHLARGNARDDGAVPCRFCLPTLKPNLWQGSARSHECRAQHPGSL